MDNGAILQVITTAMKNNSRRPQTSDILIASVDAGILYNNGVLQISSPIPEQILADKTAFYRKL